MQPIRGFNEAAASKPRSREFDHGRTSVGKAASMRPRLVSRGVLAWRGSDGRSVRGYMRPRLVSRGVGPCLDWFETEHLVASMRPRLVSRGVAAGRRSYLGFPLSLQ